MGGGLPSVSVVIPTHQRQATLAATLTPLLEDEHAHELIVVADGSTDGTTGLVERFVRLDPRVRLVQTAGLGATGARFAGAEVATGEVVLLLDDDVLAGPNLVAGHAAGHANAEKLVLVGYMPVALTKRRCGEYPRDLYARAYERHCQRWEADPDSVLRTLWAGNMSIRRTDFLSLATRAGDVAVGYHEDLELGLWMCKLGLTGRFERRLRASHLYSRSPEAFARDALSSGATLAHAHAVHGDLLGPLRKDFALQGLSRPGRWLIATARTRSWPRAILSAALPVLGAMRLFAAERYAGVLLKRILQQQGSRSIVHADRPRPRQ